MAGRASSLWLVVPFTLLSYVAIARAQTHRVAIDPERAGAPERPRLTHPSVTAGEATLEGVGSLLGAGALGTAGFFGMYGIAMSRPESHVDCTVPPRCPIGGRAGDPTPLWIASSGLALIPLGAALGAWLVAEALGRHGDFGLALLGAFIAGTVTALVGVPVTVAASDSTFLAGALVVGGLATLIVPVVVLEAAHPTVVVTPTLDGSGASIAVGGML